MADEILKKVMGSPKPRGLKRLVLMVIAAEAGDDGSLLYENAEDTFASLARCSSMRADRFSRIVRELRDDAFVTTGKGVIVVNVGGLGEAVKPSGQTTLVEPEAEDKGQGVSKGGQGNSPDGSAGAPATDVDQIIARYREVFKPRWAVAPEEERREVRAALQVASLKECLEAIDGCKASAYHQGENKNRKKFNTLTHIFKGKKGGRTRREQIDMFIDTLRKAQATTGTVKTSADPAIIDSKKEEVRRGFRLKHDPEAVTRGEKAEEFLEEHGIATTRRTDGYPLWPQIEEDG